MKMVVYAMGSREVPAEREREREGGGEDEGSASLSRLLSEGQVEACRNLLGGLWPQWPLAAGNKTRREARAAPLLVGRIQGWSSGGGFRIRGKSGG